jgi:hypothetical protein
MGQVPPPAEAARFHVMMIVTIVIGAAVLYTGVDPVMMTEYSVVFSATAVPLTYLPILIVANDSQYLVDHTDGRVTNAFASMYLVIILVASLAARPLMIVTGARDGVDRHRHVGPSASRRESVRRTRTREIPKRSRRIRPLSTQGHRPASPSLFDHARRFHHSAVELAALETDAPKGRGLSCATGVRRFHVRSCSISGQ